MQNRGARPSAGDDGEACAAGLSEADLANAFGGSLKRVRAGQGDEADTYDDWVAVAASR